ncbi:GNAT family N-acetyltransferase [Pseudoruegeria sp. HB172150]|uniref:GNAT family N-acetyltransferase n=1 Tax=Pseudoruegeria sp. HB172150 TaxID=2721164 RepID=UPI0015539279|nr:GNAT family N-acetyltransferase [Pseudoruegeria sp. HB172150]
MTVSLTGTTRLETERLILRAPEPIDYPVWEAFFLTDRATFIGGGPEHDKGRAWRAFCSLMGHWLMNGCGVFAMIDRDSGAVLGSCGPWFPSLWPEREIGWTVWDPAAEGKGYMAEAATAIIAHVFNDLRWDTAVSYIDPKNTRSMALAERLGATVDANAVSPFDDGTLVYRHPAPDAEGGMEAYA